MGLIGGDGVKGTDMAFDAINEQRDEIQRLRAKLHSARAQRDAALAELDNSRAVASRVVEAAIDNLIPEDWQPAMSPDDNAVKAIRHAGRRLAELDAVRERNEALEELADRIPNVVSYVTATLASATDDPDAKWGKVHRGRAFSSINQLKGLAKRAYELTPEEDSAA